MAQSSLVRSWKRTPNNYPAQRVVSEVNGGVVMRGGIISPDDLAHQHCAPGARTGQGISEHVSGKNFQGTGNFSREMLRAAHSITSSAKTSSSGGMGEGARWFRPSV